MKPWQFETWYENGIFETPCDVRHDYVHSKTHCTKCFRQNLLPLKFFNSNYGKRTHKLENIVKLRKIENYFKLYATIDININLFINK